LVRQYELLDDVVAFLTERILADGDRLAPAYLADGRSIPAEQELEFLTGYPGAPVKTGNWVRQQFQLDAFGEVLLLLAAAGRHDRLDDASWRAMHVAARVIEGRWSQPDAGIWELPPRQWTHSKLTCVAGLRTAARIAPRALAGRWLALADAILADAAAHGQHPSGRWQRAYDDPRVDAALLLPGIRGRSPAETRAPRRPGKQCWPSWSVTATCTGSARTPGRSATRKARSCSAASQPHSPRGRPGTLSRRPGGSSATAPRLGCLACSPGSTTCGSGNCGRTCRRRSCTR
jgi:Glycosyl hydrolases family 15